MKQGVKQVPFVRDLLLALCVLCRGKSSSAPFFVDVGFDYNDEHRFRSVSPKVVWQSVSQRLLANCIKKQRWSILHPAALKTRIL